MSFTIESGIILLLMLAIVVSNVLILLVLFRTEMLSSVNSYFLTSLTVADLSIGVFIAPFSLIASIVDGWPFGEQFCHVEAYFSAIFWIASVYSLTWLSIDHYIGIRKPERYESLMTRMRCVCWVAFIWVAAFSFCCPPLFGVARARYYPAARMCIIDWRLQKAYFITSGLLIIVPPLLALAVSNLYMFTPSYDEKKAYFAQGAEASVRPERYFSNFVVGVVFVVAWLPWCVLQLVEQLRLGERRASTDMVSGPGSPPALHFFLMWLAVANSFWKFVVYVLLDHDFRVGLKVLYTSVVCKGTSV
ncbi:hypothetical protein NP493_4201g00002 [Ridgeia piscesae]|uniref:G-protein coupled receptors family 1 profile domain-containing protein n=1 Tax=Ridgeia piscesae TaxID=27915 RepID=A0AAD9J181_RIDPI|nr:hypothetical protein NP493_4201g00002 [Ridgeia piscesae]